MITDFGPGIIPYQFALIQTSPSTQMSLLYWVAKYITLQTLEASGLDTRDPVLYEQCKGARPQGAIELSWLSQQVLPKPATRALPRIPRAQVRYMSARVFAVLVKNIASILESVRPAFAFATAGAASGVGVTSYGPVELPLELDLADVRARREHYTVALRVQDEDAFQSLATQHPNSTLAQHRNLFSNGGVTLRLTYQALTAKGRAKNPTVVDVTFPLDIFRVILRAQERIVFAQGRLAALL